MAVRSPLMANLSHSANRKHSVVIPGKEDTHYVVVRKSDAYDAIFANKPKMGVPEIQEVAKKQEEGQVQYSEKCALKIQVIDDTALIETSLNGNGRFNRNRQGSKKEKKPKRRGGNDRKKKETVEEAIHAHASVEKKGKKRLVLVYSREEMEALRFEDLDDQKKKWVEVYCGLGALVAKEYDGLVSSANIHQKHNVPNLDFDPRPQFQKSANLDAEAAIGKENHLKIFMNMLYRFLFLFHSLDIVIDRIALTLPHVLCEDCLQFTDDHFEILNTLDPASCFPVSDEIGCSPDYDSDEITVAFRGQPFWLQGNLILILTVHVMDLNILGINMEVQKLKLLVEGTCGKEFAEGIPVSLVINRRFQLGEISKGGMDPWRIGKTALLADFLELRLGLGLSFRILVQKLQSNCSLFLKNILAVRCLKVLMFENFVNLTSTDNSFHLKLLAYWKQVRQKSTYKISCFTSNLFYHINNFENGFCCSNFNAEKTNKLNGEYEHITTQHLFVVVCSFCAAVDCPLDAETSACSPKVVFTPKVCKLESCKNKIR
ncbi:hypothetical protein Pfo_016422 [Paulownia fortunei]|nr:hypothetical protein Pfo_016422 [Paulownia fortunei]